MHHNLLLITIITAYAVLFAAGCSDDTPPASQHPETTAVSTTALNQPATARPAATPQPQTFTPVPTPTVHLYARLEPDPSTVTFTAEQGIFKTFTVRTSYPRGVRLVLDPDRATYGIPKLDFGVGDTPPTHTGCPSNTRHTRQLPDGATVHLEACTYGTTTIQLIPWHREVTNLDAVQSYTISIPGPDPTRTPTPETTAERFPKPEDHNPKLDTTINEMLTDLQKPGADAEETAAQAPLHRDSSIGITVHVSDAAAVISFLAQHGVSPRHANDQQVEAFVPVDILQALADLPATLHVSVIVPPHAPQIPPEQQIVGDGPYAHRSFPWNDAGFSGYGIKIGIIDIGFAGAAELLGTELPHSVEARCYVTDTDAPIGLANCGDDTHGTIVAESIIDIAPEASLYLASTRSNGDLADIVRWMSAQGVSVINMSLGWQFDGYGDGTSPFANSPLNILAAAAADGIVWVNAAGNAGEASWLGTPTDTDADGILEFEDAGEVLNLTDTHGEYTVQLRWHGSWSGENTDLDLHILNPQENVIAQSVTEQLGDPQHIPLEIASADAGSTTIQVTTRSGEIPEWVQVVVWDAKIAEANGRGGILSPADSASAGMLATGAAHWQDLHTAQPYSSRGPTPDGREKPDITGADCGSVSTGTFCGTSQAAPHVSALAALVRQRYPDYTPQQVVSYLTEHAHLHAATLPQNTWGAGLAMLPAPPAPPNRDREALEAFYHATDGDNWNKNNNWLTDSPLDEWTGIKLNSHGRVEELILKRNFLTGEIPEEIGDLDKLQALKLHSNNLSGPIPLSMAALTELTAFRIYDNAGICTPPDPNFQKWVNSLHTRLPTCRDDDQKIVFVSDRDSPEAGFAEPNFEIYVMNADSTNQTRLTDSLGPDIQPAWSPDGTKIAFVSARDDSANIYVMDADGSNQTRLTNMRAANNLPTWSPDGQHIAFIIPRRHIYHTHEIHVMNADGSDLTTLTTEATPETFIAWSPDSKRLAYVTWAQNPDNYRETHTLFTINRDGSNPTMVFESIRASIDYPVWMPEGHHLSLAFFHRGQPVALDGDTTVPLSDLGFIGCTQHWSPDGKLIAFEHGGCSDPGVLPNFAFTRYLRSLNYTTYASIYLTNADGTGLQRLTDNESNNFHATFSPANGRPPSIWSKDSKQLLTIADWLYRHYSMYLLKADGSGTFFSPDD